jgi:drug/metabolite transporter (DMT)-like permease
MYVILALVSMVFSSIQEVMTKQVSNNGMKSGTIFINTYLFTGILRVLLIIVTVGTSFVFRPQMLLLVTPNIIMAALVTYLFLKSLKKLPISIVAPIYLLYYPLSMIFAVSVLGETVTSSKIVAMVVIGISILFLSISSSKNRLNKGLNKEHYEESHNRLNIHLGSISKGIIYILLAGVLQGILIILDKNAFNHGLTIDEMILFGGVSNIIIAFIFYQIIKREYEVKNSKYIYILDKLTLITIGIKFLAGILYTASMQMGNATVVVPITASSIVLVEILSSIFLKERLKGYQYFFIGVFLVALMVLIV